MPFDGQVLWWEYLNEDSPEDPPLRVTWGGTAPLSGWDLGTLVYRFGTDDAASAVIVWGVDINFRHGGVKAYSYWDGMDGWVRNFEPPINIMDTCLRSPDVLQTRTRDTTWTSELVDVPGCETFYEPGWAGANCYQVALRDGDQDPTTYGWLAGDYWLLPNMGFARMRLDALPGTWSLSDWEPSDSWGEW